MSTLDLQLTLRQALAEHGGVRLAILFGSQATGQATPLSDLDLAVQMAAPLQAADKIALIERLALATGLPVDLIDLKHAGEPLLGQILKQGGRLLGSDTDYAALLSRHLFAIRRSRFSALSQPHLGRTETGMDRQVIEQKLESLRRSLARIKQKTPVTVAELERDWQITHIIATRHIEYFPAFAAAMIDFMEKREGASEQVAIRETLINSKTVIASEAKQSRMSAKPMTSGSPRHSVPRDDGINQRFLGIIFPVYPKANKTRDQWITSTPR